MKQDSRGQQRAEAASDENAPFTADGVPRTLWWDDRAQVLRMIDQTLLPSRCNVIACADAAELAGAIRRLSVRGAPAIGVAAAYGLALAAREVLPTSTTVDADAALVALASAAASLRATRPTAVNLAWALDRLLVVAEAHLASGGAPAESSRAPARRGARRR